MGFFPNYTNIYPELKEVLDTRVQEKPISWRTEGGVSGLSTWGKNDSFKFNQWFNYRKCSWCLIILL